MEEQFKHIEGWGGKYSIGTFGTVVSHVFSYDRALTHKITKQGYHYVSLSTGLGKPSMKNLGVARLIAQAFIPNPNDYAEVEMINGDKDDLRVDNIRWVAHDPNSRKHPSYIYKAWHRDSPHTGIVVYTMRDLLKHTGLAPISVTNYLLRHPGEYGSSGWAITCERKPGFGRSRLEK